MRILQFILIVFTLSVILYQLYYLYTQIHKRHYALKNTSSYSTGVQQNLIKASSALINGKIRLHLLSNSADPYDGSIALIKYKEFLETSLMESIKLLTKDDNIDG